MQYLLQRAFHIGKAVGGEEAQRRSSSIAATSSPTALPSGSGIAPALEVFIVLRDGVPVRLDQVHPLQVVRRGEVEDLVEVPVPAVPLPAVAGVHVATTRHEQTSSRRPSTGRTFLPG